MSERARRRLGSAVMVMGAGLIFGVFAQGVATVLESTNGSMIQVGNILKFWLIGVSLFLLPACGVVDWVAQVVARTNSQHKAFARAHHGHRSELKPPPGSPAATHAPHGVAPAEAAVPDIVEVPDVVDVPDIPATPDVVDVPDVPDVPDAVAPVADVPDPPLPTGGVSVPAVIEPPAVEQPGTTDAPAPDTDNPQA